MSNIAKLDKLSFTFPVHPDYRIQVKRDMYNVSDRMKNVIRKSKYAVTRSGLPPDTGDTKYGGLKKRYKYNILLTFQDTNNPNRIFYVIVSFQPKNKSHNFIRVEFNPNNAKSSGVKLLAKILNSLAIPDSTLTVYDMATTTRLDTCIDKVNLPIDFLPYAPRFETSLIERSNDNETETYWVGQIGSRSIFKFYRKDIEQFVKKNIDMPITTRFEYQRRSRWAFNKVDISLIKARMEICDFFNTDFVGSQTTCPAFDKDALENGFDHALGNVGKFWPELNQTQIASRKTRIRRYLRKHYRIDPFNLETDELDLSMITKVLELFR